MEKNIALANGWNFTREDYYYAQAQGQVLTVQMEGGSYCLLNCLYCFRRHTFIGKTKEKIATMGEQLHQIENPTPQDIIDLIDGNKNKNTIKRYINNYFERRRKNQINRSNKQMSLKESLNLIDIAADMGAQTINIIGAGEPLTDPHMQKMIQRINEKNMVPVIFTNGVMLSEDNNWIDFLWDNNATVILKFNSFKAEIQDFLAWRPGYTELRDVAKDKLIAKGFNQPGIWNNREFDTRMGIDSIVAKVNQSEIIDIFRMCIEEKLMPIITTFIPAGRTEKEIGNWELTKNEFLELQLEIRDKIVREMVVDFSVLENGLLRPYLGGVDCTQCGPWSFYVTIDGNIYECPAQEHPVGSIYDITAGNNPKTNTKIITKKTMRKSIKQAFGEIRKTDPNVICPPRGNRWEHEMNGKMNILRKRKSNINPCNSCGGECPLQTKEIIKKIIK